MNSDTPLDYAVFSLSPSRSRCELFVSGGGRTEKLASGSLKPFVSHLRVAEEQDSQSIKLELEGADNACSWFNKGTLERFVRFVSTPEVLELVNAFDAEVSQLEGARRIYSQGSGNQSSAASLGEVERARAAAADITKKELLRAIDDRLVAVRQDLTLACARASAAGFTLDNVSELLLFADRFGAERLNEACTKFISLCHLRPELTCHQHPELISHQRAPLPSLLTHLKGFNDGNIRCSSDSDMSIAEPEVEPSSSTNSITNIASNPQLVHTSNNRPSLNAAVEPTSTYQQSKPIARHITEKDVEQAAKERTSSSTSAETNQKAGGGGSRRLSVQDRINLFESKQKEQSAGADIINNIVGSATNKVSGKPEHRRLPSDISEKSVLRRWSGTSDMSIDLNNSNNSCAEKKDSGSPMAFSSSANSEPQSGSKAEESNPLQDTTTSRTDFYVKNLPTATPSSSLLSLSEVQVRASPKETDQAEVVYLREVILASKMQPISTLEEDNQSSQAHSGSSSDKVWQRGLNAQVDSMAKTKPIPKSSELVRLKDQDNSGTQFKHIKEENVQVKDYTVLRSPPRDLPAEENQARRKEKVNMRSQHQDTTGPDVQVKDLPDYVTKFKTFATEEENDGANMKDLDSQLQSKSSVGKAEDIVPNIDLTLGAQPTWKRFPPKREVGRKELAAFQVLQGTLLGKADEDPFRQGVMFPKQASTSDQTMKLHGKKDQMSLNQENTATVSFVNKAKEGAEMFGFSTNSMEHEVVGPPKGRQELNDALQMKANELEKLFAAHKHRVRDDQTSSSRRSKPINVEVKEIPLAMEKRLTEANPDRSQEQIPLKKKSSNEAEHDGTMLLRMVESRDYSSDMKQWLGDSCPSDEFRGEFYEKYMQKRDAKLREDWGSKRVQKEAKLKAMNDSLERSQAAMKAKVAGSASRQDQSSAHRRAEKMSSFKARLALKNKGQAIKHLQVEEEEDQQLSGQFSYAQDKSDSDSLFGSEHSSLLSRKKLSSNKLASSSTPKTPVIVPRPSAKGTNYGSMKRRMQPENSLAQSVPNFSDFRKENTKPSTGVSKVNPRTQSKNLVRSKSSTEDMKVVKEENSRRSQSMRKSSANSVELKNISSLSFDGVSMPLLKSSKEHTEHSISSKIPRSSELRPFLRKGNGIGPGAGAGIAKLKTPTASEILTNDEASEDDLSDMIKNEEEEFERPSTEGNLRNMDFSVDSDSEKPRRSQESGNSGDLGSENGDLLKSLSRADEMVAVSSNFDTSRNMMDSPGESPGSWNSHIHHQFSYAHETSDVDAFVDSPTGSPAFWNSNPLNQMIDVDAARMRKTWGVAQVPVLAANASHQSHKDVKKGFKRLLKFGRKSKGSEFLVNDWVSASTASEGDDDTEDGRDLTNRSSEDLRKTRMGYPVVAYDDFNEGEVYPEQVQSLRSSIPNPPANFRLRDERLSGSSLKAPRSFFSFMVSKQGK